MNILGPRLRGDDELLSLSYAALSKRRDALISSSSRSLAAHTLAAGIAALALTGHSLVAVAQSYPARPVRLVVPFPPGGSNDIVGRVVAAGLSDRLGKYVAAEMAKWAQVARIAGIKGE